MKSADSSLRSTLSSVLLLAALLYSLVYVFCGFGNKMDPFFWLNKYQEMDSGWMAYGTVLLGHLWICLTGPSILSLRLLSWICTVTALALPYCCLLSREQRRQNLHWLAVTYLLMGYGTFQEFSTGTVSILLLSILIVLYVKKKYVGLGCVMALAILARFPNVLALPILGLGLTIPPLTCNTSNTSQPGRTSLTRFLSTFFLTLILGYSLWYLTTTQQMAAPSDNHTIHKMLAQLVDFSFFRFAPHQWYNQTLHFLVSLSVVILAISKSITARRSFYFFLFPLLILMVLPLGSDTGWLKLFPGILCLLPWFMAETGPTRSASPVAKAAIFLFFLLGGCCTEWLCTTNAIGNRNLTTCDTWSHTTPMQGLLINQPQEQRLRQIRADYELFSQQGKVYVLGEDIHLMRSLTGAPRPYRNEFWSNIYDKVYTRWYQPLIRQRAIFLISDTPCFILDKKKQKLHQSLLEQSLLEQGYRLVDRSRFQYMIYLPPETSAATPGNGKSSLATSGKIQ